MKRRSFLQAMLAAGVAPAAIGSGILMPVREIAVPSNYMSICALEQALIDIELLTDDKGLKFYLPPSQWLVHHELVPDAERILRSVAYYRDARSFFA